MYKLKLVFELNRNVVPNNLNIVFASFLKNTLQIYNNNLYKQMFCDKGKKNRQYCYSLLMKPINREKGYVILQDNQFGVELTDLKFDELLAIYNAFCLKLKQKEYYPMKNNSMMLCNVQLKMYRPLISNHVIVKMKSPLIVRSYNDNGEQYLNFDDENFEKVLNQSIQRFLTENGMKNVDVIVKPIKAKKTVINLYKFKVNASLGFFEIKGDPQLISVLCYSGIGSCRSAGAGMFRVVG